MQKTVENKPLLMLLPEVHNDTELIDNEARAILGFRPQVTYLEMYKFTPETVRTVVNFYEVDLQTLKELWNMPYPFENYLPVINAIIEVRAKVVPLSPPDSYLKYLSDYLSKHGNSFPERQFMPQIIKHTHTYTSRKTASVGAGHTISKIDYLHGLGDWFQILYPEYVRSFVKKSFGIENLEAWNPV